MAVTWTPEKSEQDRFQENPKRLLKSLCTPQERVIFNRCYEQKRTICMHAARLRCSSSDYVT